MIITKRLEFDAGHRVPSHHGKCRNFHGHRYVVEVSFIGPVLPVRGQTDDGMVLDFGDLKTLIHDTVISPWDHAFLIYEHDQVGRLALSHLGPDHHTVVLPVIPTAENLCTIIIQQLKSILQAHLTFQTFHTLMPYKVRLYETPNSWAEEEVRS